MKRSVEHAVIIASAARTATGSEEVIVPANAVGAIFYLGITAASGTTPTLDVKLQEIDPVSEVAADMSGAAFAQKTTTGSDMLQVAPGLYAVANKAVGMVLPRRLKVVWTIGGTTPSFTFPIAADWLFEH